MLCIFGVVLAYEQTRERSHAELRSTQRALRVACEDLESGVRERTAEIERSHRELERSHARLLAEVQGREAAERGLDQARKMEAVGRLAGGVAHDFNNLLMVVKGQGELLCRRLEKCLGERPPELERIQEAATRGADLTRQLLTFSRREKASPVNLDLRDLVGGVARLCRRTLGEGIELDVDLPDEPVVLRADRGQIEQVMLNLMVNARDAMPSGGTIQVRLGWTELDRETALGPFSVPPGSYASLTIVDDGVGIEPEAQDRIFEPFFTTKELGNGTGLGLATVYGIVEDLGGSISVESEPGRGSSFRVLLPRTSAAPDPMAVEPAPAPTRGSERVLLAEDEPAVRELLVGVLESKGYRVTAAADGEAALEAFSPDTVDLLVTDVMMPRMRGPELAARVREIRPDLPVVFLSGRMLDAEIAISDGPGVACIAKPCRPSELLTRMRALLEA